MKGNMKKLALLVIITVVGSFIMAAMASANAIRGQYASTAAGECILAPFGFNPDLTPINGVASIQWFTREAYFTFENDGTGSVTATGHSVHLSVPSIASSQTMSWDFTYAVTDGGMITIAQVPGTFFTTFTPGPNTGLTYRMEGMSLKGTITPDGKIITLTGGAPNVLPIYGPNLPSGGASQICNWSAILIWQENEKP